MTQIAPGVYAARSGNRVTVFNRAQILGVGTCLEDEDGAKDTATAAQ